MNSTHPFAINLPKRRFQCARCRASKYNMYCYIHCIPVPVWTTRCGSAHTFTHKCRLLHCDKVIHSKTSNHGRERASRDLFLDIFSRVCRCAAAARECPEREREQYSICRPAPVQGVSKLCPFSFGALSLHSLGSKWFRSSLKLSQILS